MRVADVMPEILVLLRKSGPLRTVLIKDHAVVIADRKGLVYRDEQVTNALTILKSNELASNVTNGYWSATSGGAERSKITKHEAQEFVTGWRNRMRNARRRRPL
jgi:hypothetical protein